MENADTDIIARPADLSSTSEEVEENGKKNQNNHNHDEFQTHPVVYPCPNSNPLCLS